MLRYTSIRAPFPLVWHQSRLARSPTHPSSRYTPRASSPPSEIEMGSVSVRTRLCAALLLVAVLCTRTESAAVFTPFWHRFCLSQPAATCFFAPIGGSGISGQVKFEPVWHRGQCQTLITGTIEGMAAGAVQAIHVHTKGDISSPKGLGTKGHFTHPYGQPTLHGMPWDEGHDWGDLGNIEANALGVATYKRIDPTISWTNALLGRGMIIHASRDKGRPFAAKNGDAGKRAAQCVIGYL